MKKLFALILFIAPFIAQAQVTGLELPYGVKVLDTLATDAWYGPYPDIETALESIPEAVRKNRTIKIGTQEYWWRDGNADEDLILKSSAPAQTTVPWDSITSRPTTLSGYGITDAWPLNGTGNVTGNVDIDYGSSLRTTRIGSMSWHNRYVQIGTGNLWVKGFQQHNWGDRSLGLGSSEVGWYYHAGDFLQENTTVPKFEATAKEINFSIKKWTNNNIGQGFRLLGSVEESTWFRFDPQAGYFDITLYPENEWLDNDYAAFLKYSADYSDYYIDSARWIPDVGAVKKIMNEGSFWNRNGTTTINTDEPYATVIDGQGNGPLEFVDLWGFKVRSLGGYQFEEVPQSTDSVGRILTINEDGIMGWVPKDSLGAGVGGGSVTFGDAGTVPIVNATEDDFDYTSYKLPLTDGTNGQVLKTDGSGNVTWQDDDDSGGGGGVTIEQVMDSIYNFADSIVFHSGFETTKNFVGKANFFSLNSATGQFSFSTSQPAMVWEYGKPTVFFSHDFLTISADDKVNIQADSVIVGNTGQHILFKGLEDNNDSDSVLVVDGSGRTYYRDASTLGGGGGGEGLTSVGISMPTGFSVSGSPLTSNGTITVSYAAGYQGYTSTEASKLSGIEAGADVTDATNVAAAGAIMDGDFSANGMMARTAAGTYASRTITGTADRISVSNGTGQSGNPTIDIASTYAGQNTITTLGTITTGTWNATDIPLSAGGTGASLSDPGADRIMFWDDSDGAVEWLEVGSGLSITGNTLSATGGGGGSYISTVGTSTIDATGATVELESENQTEFAIQTDGTDFVKFQVNTYDTPSEFQSAALIAHENSSDTRAGFGVNNISGVTASMSASVEGTTILGISVSPTSLSIHDGRETKVGIVYQGDYSATFTERSLVDKGYVDGALTGGASANELIMSDGTTPIGSGLLISTGAGTRTIAPESTSESTILLGYNQTNTQIESALTNGVGYFGIIHNTSGTPATGIGTGILFSTETASGNSEIGASIDAITTDVTSASEDFDISFKLMAGGATRTEKFRFASTGTGTATDWVATSDRRLKENIRPADNQLDKIIHLSGLIRTYDRKDTGKEETGFIAQELLEVAPEYVEVPADTTKMMGVNYSKMVVPIYRGVAEVHQENELLRQEINEMRAQIEELRAIIEAMKK